MGHMHEGRFVSKLFKNVKICTKVSCFNTPQHVHNISRIADPLKNTTNRPKFKSSLSITTHLPQNNSNSCPSHDDAITRKLNDHVPQMMGNK